MQPFLLYFWPSIRDSGLRAIPNRKKVAILVASLFLVLGLHRDDAEAGYARCGAWVDGDPNAYRRNECRLIPYWNEVLRIIFVASALQGVGGAACARYNRYVQT